tara:strand:+ start:1264 stop:1686 length:423 start_codon:yes stop_codon:yes gene_type:complete
LIEKSKDKNSDKKEWEEFINNPSDLYDKDQLENQKKQIGRYKFDFHGYSIERANKKIYEIIAQCLEKEFKEILIITGKGIHSNKEDDVYTSKDYNKLQNTIPEFIKSNPDLKSKVLKIQKAPKELGGEGALIIKLRKIIK